MLALVKEASFGDPSLVLRGDLDVSRSQQEDLVRHPLDATAKTEDEPGREVDQTLRVTVDHLGQVHDHWCTFTEVLPNGTCFIVGPWMQCCNTGEIGRLRHVLSTPLGGLVATVIFPGRARFRLLGYVCPRCLVFVVVVVLVRVVLGLVAVIVLHEAEVDRHLAHSAGHPSVLRACTHRPQPFRPNASASRTGHYMTTGPRPPSNAVPIRRCVAPHAIAASRSPLMPAEIIVAAGLTARTCAALSSSRANASAGFMDSGATAITPARSRSGSDARASARAGTSVAGAPPRAGSPSRLTSIRQLIGRPARRAALPRARTSRGRSTECTTLA